MMTPTGPCPPGTTSHLIQAGDVLWRIAQRFSISVADLLEANPGVDPSRLFVGQVICIPLATHPVRCPTGSRTYVVARGDTLADIARYYGVSLQALIQANPGLNPEYLLIGQRLCVPTR